MTISKEGKIEVTGVDLPAFVRAAYDLSRPQGMGFLHAQPGPLPDEEVSRILDREKPNSYIACSMDYVLGRAVKMVVWRDTDTGNLYIRDSWFDHHPTQLVELLNRVGLADKTALVPA